MDNFENNPITPEMQPQPQPQEQFAQQQQYEQQQQYAQQQQYEQQQQYAQQQYAQQQYAPSYGQPAPVRPKKSNHVLISVIAGLLCIIMAFASVAYTCSVHIFDIPVISFIMGMANEDLEDEYDEMISRMEDDIDEMPEEEAEEFEDIMGVTPDEFIDDFSQLSLNSMLKWSNKVIAASGEIEGFEMSSEDIAPLYYLNGLRIGFYGYAAFISLFVLLGTLLKRKALTIVGLVLGSGYVLALGGVLIFALFLVTGIVQCVFATLYRKSLKAAPAPVMYQPMA